MTHMTQGYLELSNTKHILNLEWEAGWENVPGTSWETTLLYEHYFNRFSRLIAGLNTEGTVTTGPLDFDVETNRGVFGFMYQLPLNIDTIHRMMETHKAAAITMFSATAILTVWSRWITLEKRGNFIWFAGTLTLLNCLLASVGDLGARMVYQQGAGVMPAALMIQGQSPETNEEGANPEAVHGKHDHDH